MNTHITLRKEIGLVALIVTALLVSFGAASVVSANSHNVDWDDMNDDANGSIYETTMMGSKEVPSISDMSVSGYSGVWFGDNGSGMNYWLEVYNGDEVIAAHLHCADTDENGPVVVTLFSNSNGVDVHGKLSSGDITDSSIEGTAEDCEDSIGYAIDNVEELAQAIEDGDIYVNVHTTDYPAGAARGQLAFRENTNDDNDEENGNDDDNSYGDDNNDYNNHKDDNDWKNEEHDDWDNGKDGSSDESDNDRWHDEKDWNNDDDHEWDDNDDWQHSRDSHPIRSITGLKVWGDWDN